MSSYKIRTISDEIRNEVEKLFSAAAFPKVNGTFEFFCKTSGILMSSFLEISSKYMHGLTDKSHHTHKIVDSFETSVTLQKLIFFFVHQLCYGYLAVF